jgi:hypothetical protein
VLGRVRRLGFAAGRAAGAAAASPRRPARDASGHARMSDAAPDEDFVSGA